MKRSESRKDLSSLLQKAEKIQEEETAQEKSKDISSLSSAVQTTPNEDLLNHLFDIRLFLYDAHKTGETNISPDGNGTLSHSFAVQYWLNSPKNLELKQRTLMINDLIRKAVAQTGFSPKPMLTERYEFRDAMRSSYEKENTDHLKTYLNNHPKVAAAIRENLDDLLEIGQEWSKFTEKMHQKQHMAEVEEAIDQPRERGRF